MVIVFNHWKNIRKTTVQWSLQDDIACRLVGVNSTIQNSGRFAKG